MAPADRRAAEEHLAACADCRREAAAMQGYFRELSGLPALKAPDRFLTKVHARIAKASPWKRLLAALSSPRLLPVPLLGLAVLLVGVYFAFLSPRLAEQALPVAQTAPAGPAPEPGAPAAPYAAKPAPSAEERLATASPEVNRTEQAARKAAPARFGSDQDAVGPAPTGNPSRAPAEAGAADAGAPKAKADKRSAPTAGSDPVADRVAHHPGPDVHMSDEPVPAPAAPAAKAEAALKDKAPATRMAAKVASAEPETEAGSESGPPGRKGAAPAPAPQALARGGSKDRNLRALEAEDDLAYSEAAVPYAKEGASAAAAPPALPATTAKPWAPLGYTLKARVGEATLRGGLRKLGVKVLRQDPASGRYELEVPATRIIDLETHLRSLGSLSPSPRPLPGPKDGAPIRLTLQVAAP